MRKHFGILTAMVAMGAITAAPVSASGGNKDFGIVRSLPSRPVSQKRFVGASDANPYKYNKTPKSNQRQKRKYLRQNPHMRRKYKN